MTASADELGALVARLRRSYSVALAFARDLPGLGRCLVKIDRPGHRRKKRLWVARFPTRLYVETHVRNQLDHLVGCLRDEMLDPANEERLGPIVSSLEESAGRLTSWKRVKGAFLRLPPVAAALPVLVTAATNPLTDVESREVIGAATVVVTSAVLAYCLFVWPSLSLGFRVKRAIFCGGVDLASPSSAHPGTATWRGFPVDEAPPRGLMIDNLIHWRARRRARRAPAAGRQKPAGGEHRLVEFPKTDVYRDENLLFAHLGRRKREEAPIDLVLSLFPYVLTLVTAVAVVRSIAFLVGGGVEEDPERLFFAPLVAMLPLALVEVLRNMRANVWDRRRHWESDPPSGTPRSLEGDPPPGS